MRTLAILIAAAGVLSGCTAHAAREPAPAMTNPSGTNTTGMKNLDGSQWRFTSVAGKAVPPGVTATMRLRDGRASGKAGCNAYGATYRIAADGSATFTPGMSTKMACLEPAGVMQVERGIFAAFRGTVRVELRGGALWMLDADGKPLAELAPAADPP